MIVYIISLVRNDYDWLVCVSDKNLKFTHRFWEVDLSVAKFKGLIKAKELGWNINNLNINK